MKVKQTTFTLGSRALILQVYSKESLVLPSLFAFLTCLRIHTVLLKIKHTLLSLPCTHSLLYLSLAICTFLPSQALDEPILVPHAATPGPEGKLAYENIFRAYQVGKPFWLPCSGSAVLTLLCIRWL